MKKKLSLGLIALVALTVLGTPSLAQAEDGSTAAPKVGKITGGWYTETDDTAPRVVAGDLVFTAPGNDAVGIRKVTSYPIADLVQPAYTATGDTPFLHVRAVVDVDGTYVWADGKQWHDDYLSLSFLSDGTVYVSAMGQSYTLDEVKAQFPGTITSIGFHFDSNAPAGASATLTSTELKPSGWKVSGPKPSL